MEMYYNINGIISEKPNNDKFWITDLHGDFFIQGNDISSDVNFECVNLINLLAEKIFGSVESFHVLSMVQPQWIPYSGIDTEISISKTNFEKLYTSNKSEILNKLLYYYDFRNKIGSLQNLIIESRYLFGEFYKTFNINSFMLGSNPFEPDSLMFSSGILVTNIFSKINHLFINLSSQLDFITKIFYEYQNLPKDFNEYPKLKCYNILYDDFKRINLPNVLGSVFEKIDNLKLIINLRNEIIHNSSFENISKVYQKFENNKMVEKFILIPDSINGNFDTFRNRNRFFYNNIKLNEILPDLVFDFWNRMLATVKLCTIQK